MAPQVTRGCPGTRSRRNRHPLKPIGAEKQIMPLPRRMHLMSKEQFRLIVDRRRMQALVLLSIRTTLSPARPARRRRDARRSWMTRSLLLVTPHLKNSADPDEEEQHTHVRGSAVSVGLYQACRTAGLAEGLEAAGRWLNVRQYDFNDAPGNWPLRGGAKALTYGYCAAGFPAAFLLCRRWSISAQAWQNPPTKRACATASPPSPDVSSTTFPCANPMRISS